MVVYSLKKGVMKRVSGVKWIKIVTDIFDDEKMFAIESLPDGQLIELCWFKVLCLAGKSNNNGFLMVANKIPYTDEMLSSVFRMELGTVKRALETFEKLEMIEVVDDAYMVSNWLLHQSGDRLEEMKEQNRKRQAKHREKQRLITSNVTNNVTDNVINNVNCSYSYSNSKSNIYNLNSLINTNNYIGINEELIEVLKDWLEYKDAKGKQHLHYAEKSLNGLIKKFIDMEQAIGISGVKRAVEETITQGWQGIVWEKADAKPKSNNAYLDRIDNRINVVDSWV